MVFSVVLALATTLNKEIKIGPIYERCSRLILLILHLGVSWMLNLSSIITHGFDSEYEYDAYLSYGKQRKIYSVQSMLLFGQGVVGNLNRWW